MQNRIPPVGRHISTHKSAGAPALSPSPSQCVLVNSGTEALALAIQSAISADLRQTANPEIIIPGYCCPDLLSACLYAGATPILVDLEPERPYMSLDKLLEAITPNTIAIVAVNFLGIPERINAIRDTINNPSILIIEDSAQWFPTSPGHFAIDNFQGDLVIVSFGKGKPVSLLGGGALFVRNELLEHHITKPEPTTASLISNITFVAKLLAYNTIITPYFYWLLETLPFVELGSTRFHPLDTISSMKPENKDYLGSNIESYQRQNNNTQDKLAEKLSKSGVIDLPARCETYSNQRLLRFPVLTKTPEQHDRVLTRLQALGCGASGLYPSALPEIEGVSSILTNKFSGLKYSSDFASRLVTLPTHPNVSEQHLRTIFDVLNSPG